MERWKTGATQEYLELLTYYQDVPTGHFVQENDLVCEIWSQAEFDISLRDEVDPMSRRDISWVEKWKYFQLRSVGTPRAMV